MCIVYSQWLSNEILLRQLYGACYTRPLLLYAKGAGSETTLYSDGSCAL